MGPACNAELARLPDRVLSKIEVDAASACWLWTGSRDRDGYARISVRRVNQKAARHVYELLRSAIPRGLECDHLCRVRACVNPTHLEPVTHVENMRRASRARTEAERIVPRQPPLWDGAPDAA